jgi:hypothetical protein
MKGTRRRAPIAASELKKLLEADSDFAMRRNERNAEISARYARIKTEQKELLGQLKLFGFELESVADLINMPNVYAEVLPLLVDHLQLPYSDVTKETIARALAVPESQVFWPILVREFRDAPSGKGIVAPHDTMLLPYGAKDGLACALAASVTDETLPELIKLAKDKSLGDSRILLLSALRRRRKKNPLVREALEELVNDPQLATEITSWRKLK